MEIAEESMEESDGYQNIQRAVCSDRPDPDLVHLEEWGWIESSPWPGPCEVLVQVLFSDAGVVYIQDSLSSHDPCHHTENSVALWALGLPLDRRHLSRSPFSSFCAFSGNPSYSDRFSHIYDSSGH